MLYYTLFLSTDNVNCRYNYSTQQYYYLIDTATNYFKTHKLSTNLLHCMRVIYLIVLNIITKNYKESYDIKISVQVRDAFMF